MININLVNELEGKEMTLCELDNVLIAYGVPSVYDEIDPDSLIEDESVSYWVDDSQGINILFDVIDYKEDSPIDTVVNIKRIEEI
jgi:hypothetical protein|nr:MAG TPA: hypothetical protein [Caudoviricetes sp.]